MFRLLVLGGLSFLIGCSASPPPGVKAANARELNSLEQFKCNRSAMDFLQRSEAFLLCRQQVGCQVHYDTILQMQQAKARATVDCE